MYAVHALLLSNSGDFGHDEAETEWLSLTREVIVSYDEY